MEMVSSHSRDGYVVKGVVLVALLALGMLPPSGVYLMIGSGVTSLAIIYLGKADWTLANLALMASIVVGVSLMAAVTVFVVSWFAFGVSHVYSIEWPYVAWLTTLAFFIITQDNLKEDRDATGSQDRLD